LPGAIELVFDYGHAIRAGLPAVAGELGAAYAMPILYVLLLMITHVVAFYLMARCFPHARNRECLDLA
jgi:hypothetical protein